jgi:N-acetylmuramoyl-L-alanine amidase
MTINLKFKQTILILTTLIGFAELAYPQKNPYFYKPQPKSIKEIIKKERKTTNYKKLIHIINRIDEVYSDLYRKLQKGQKIVVFFDPAHGKLPDGRWQGGKATRRLSCTHRPEEYYSVLFSREMYRLLNNNSHISVKSTPDFMNVLQNKTNIYKNIPFVETIKLAEKYNAFIIISEHLNNVLMVNKVNGIKNIPGIHLTKDRYGRKYLKFFDKSFSGFLTLYNTLDASGFSEKYALKLKENLVAQGIKPNDWEFGAVADDRFTYFTNFPISIIYESGFISNPQEEKKLRNPEYIKRIVKNQYHSLIENIKETFGLDISGATLKKIQKSPQAEIELLKLARLIVFYTKKGETKKALHSIKIMENKYGQTDYKNYIDYYKDIKDILIESEKYYKLGQKYKQRKKIEKAVEFFLKAKENLSDSPILDIYNQKYTKAIPKNFKKSKKKTRKLISKKIPQHKKKIILPIKEGQSLKEAIKLALAPSSSKIKKLLKSFQRAQKVTWKKVKIYSKKKKKRITTWKKRIKRIKFNKGIYLVSLNKNLKITKTKRVSSVRLNPKKYQNQQYLKNSFLAVAANK